ncbi:SDR family NAD(P)-dependent oxidoreductase [Sedimentitalea todarodis]|uniref:SDR family NAD(P)-dependent oxidoreductase n=1 Tax=Sedimentitalea todarodis TaxID=1631240 RepID=A0ABU3VHF5_9RHOB|nr:SDR family NAD(P)-dependent oxidoreductase [Sedimentitalea todarodis]MDU9005591.1 SDR family NAD(P)-dependent oxidoreductase [Sedimentitalea todarodis]
MIEPTDRVVMVSGGSRGIGLAIAQLLHAKGYSVSVGARNVAALEHALRDQPGARLLCARYEADDRTSHDIWLAATLEKFGRLDALVNNAGTSNTFSIEAGDEADLDALWTINVKGPLFLTRICLPHLKAAGSGRIVNVASLSGKRVRNDNIAYNMTKHAVLALTHGTRRIGWDHGVRATAICPSFVATDLTVNVTEVSQAEMIDPRDLAELAATAIALPNTAAMAEMLVNCRLEDTL